MNTKVELHLKYREDMVDQYARKLNYEWVQQGTGSEDPIKWYQGLHH